MIRYSPRQQYKEARIIAEENGMFVVDRGSYYLLYRQASPSNVFLGRRDSAASLRSLVARCAGSR